MDPRNDEELLRDLPTLLGGADCACALEELAGRLPRSAFLRAHIEEIGRLTGGTSRRFPRESSAFFRAAFASRALSPSAASKWGAYCIPATDMEAVKKECAALLRAGIVKPEWLPVSIFHFVFPADREAVEGSLELGTDSLLLRELGYELASGRAADLLRDQGAEGEETAFPNDLSARSDSLHKMVWFAKTTERPYWAERALERIRSDWWRRDCLPLVFQLWEEGSFRRLVVEWIKGVWAEFDQDWSELLDELDAQILVKDKHRSRTWKPAPVELHRFWKALAEALVRSNPPGEGLFAAIDLFLNSFGEPSLADEPPDSHVQEALNSRASTEKRSERAAVVLLQQLLRIPPLAAPETLMEACLTLDDWTSLGIDVLCACGRKDAMRALLKHFLRGGSGDAVLGDELEALGEHDQILEWRRILEALLLEELESSFPEMEEQLVLTTLREIGRAGAVARMKTLESRGRRHLREVRVEIEKESRRRELTRDEMSAGWQRAIRTLRLRQR